MLVVNASSAKRAEELLDWLRGPSAACRLFRCPKYTVAEVMTDWLLQGTHDCGFGIWP
jgi:DNA recombination-dependent growth factor C